MEEKEVLIFGISEDWIGIIFILSAWLLFYVVFRIVKWRVEKKQKINGIPYNNELRRFRTDD